MVIADTQPHRLYPIQQMAYVSQGLQLSRLLILMLFKALKTSTNLRLQNLKIKVFMSPRHQAIPLLVVSH